MLKLATILAFTNLVLSQNPSPCPEIFNYEPRGNETDRWYGSVQVQTPEDLNGVWLHIILDRPGEVLGNWFGETSSTDNIEFIVRNAKYKLEAGPPVSIRFFIKYNPVQTIPSVQIIRLNGKTICPAQRQQSELKPIEPTLHISNSENSAEISNVNSDGDENNNRRPVNSQNSQQSKPGSGNASFRPSSNSRPDFRPGFNGNSDKNSQGTGQSSSSSSSSTSNSNVAPLSEENRTESQLDYFPSDFAQINTSPGNKKPLPAVSSKKPQCGMVPQQPRPLISFGQSTMPGEWPWHAALYRSSGLQVVYTCGGTLVSEQHVVTAAHCVTKPETNRKVDLGNLLVYLGKYNLVSFGSEVQVREVSDIFVYPNYNYTLYFNDLAILKLSRPVDLTNFVRPCCLWEGSNNLQNIINQEGTVVGWGFDDKGNISNKLMQAHMPIVSTETCIYSNRNFFSNFLSEDSFCAGFRNGTSVCNGDSGGGMVFPRKGTSGQNTVWQLRGVVSIGVALQGEKICDPYQYTVFTDVAKHLPWVKKVLNNNN